MLEVGSWFEDWAEPYIPIHTMTPPRDSQVSVRVSQGQWRGQRGLLPWPGQRGLLTVARSESGTVSVSGRVGL